jgi:hypothetical protein
MEIGPLNPISLEIGKVLQVTGIECRKPVPYTVSTTISWFSSTNTGAISLILLTGADVSTSIIPAQSQGQCCALLKREKKMNNKRIVPSHRGGFP